MGASGASVATAFAINIGITLVIFFLFSYLRITAFARRFYAPKRFDASVEHKPRRLPPGFFGWIPVVYTYPETELIKVSGLDSAMYIRILLLGWEVFVKVAIVTIIIILPINLSGNRIDVLLDQQNGPPPPPFPPPPAGCSVTEDSISANTDKYSFTSFDHCSLANLPPGSPKLWAHVVVQWVITFVVMTTLWRFNHEATLLRLAFLANSPRGGPSHTVLITDIPGMKHGTLAWYLRGLAGSTLFVLLPAKLKRKVLDSMESGLSAAVSLDMASTVGSTLEKVGVVNKADALDKASLDPKKPQVLDAFTSGALVNTKVAEKAQAKQRRKTLGILHSHRKTPEVVSTDPKLDPWVQAGEMLGDALEPRADKVQEFIHTEVEFAYGGGCVAAVNPVWDQGPLNSVLAELNALKQKLEDRLDLLASRLKRRKKMPKPLKLTIMGPTLGSWGIEKYGMKPVKVDALDYWPQRIEYLSGIVPKLQQQCMTKAIPAAFVTLESRHAQAVMTTTLHHHDETTWQIQGAPEPKEIIWGSLSMRKWERAVRSLGMWALFVLLLCFYMIPIAAVQALIEVPKLAAIPVLGTIVNLPFIKQVIEGILPGLILVIFLALLPSLLAFMCRLSGFVSISQVDFGVITRYFYFQVVALFLGSIIAGSFFNQIKQLLGDPQSIVRILGVAIPVTSTFFINYILVAGIGKTGIKHLRIPQFVIFWILSRIAATPRARARLWADQYILYGPEAPSHNIIFFLGLVYCCVNPIIAPVCLLYYSFTIISARYNNLYVFKRTYESGGRLWQCVFNQFVLALYIMQIVMIILLSLKEFKPVFLLIPLPIITFIFHVTCLSLFQRPWSNMSAHDAAQLDVLDAKERGGTEMTYKELKTIQDMYLSPAFKVRPDDVEDLLEETEIVKRRMAGEKLEDIEADLEDKGWVSAEEDLDEFKDEGPEDDKDTKGGPPVLPVSTKAGDSDKANGKGATANGTLGKSAGGAAEAPPAKTGALSSFFGGKPARQGYSVSRPLVDPEEFAATQQKSATAGGADDKIKTATPTAMLVLAPAVAKSAGGATPATSSSGKSTPSAATIPPSPFDPSSKQAGSFSNVGKQQGPGKAGGAPSRLGK